MRTEALTAADVDVNSRQRKRQYWSRNNSSRKDKN